MPALLDALAMGLAGVMAPALRSALVGAGEASTSRLTFAALAVVMTAGWLFTMTFGAAYQRLIVDSGSKEHWRVFAAALRFVAGVAVLALTFQVDVARGFVTIVIPLATLLSLILRDLLRKGLHHQRERGRLGRRALIVGGHHKSEEMARHTQYALRAGLLRMGARMPEPLGASAVDGRRLEVLTQSSEVRDAAVASRADAVVIADAGTPSVGALRRLAWQLEGTGVDSTVTPAVTDLAGPRISIRPLPDLPLLYPEEPQLSGFPRLAKGFDRFLVTVGLVLLSPLLAVTAVLVRVTSRGPALFRQVRVRLSGRHFVMYKFRTMASDAEAHLSGLVHLNDTTGCFSRFAWTPA